VAAQVSSDFRLQMCIKDARILQFANIRADPLPNTYLSQEAGGFYNPANRLAAKHTYGVISSRRDSMQGCILRRLALAEFFNLGIS